MDGELLRMPLTTVEEACQFYAALDELIAKGKSFPPVSHIFFAKVDCGLTFEPYQIRAVAKNNRPKNYYIVTRDSVIHVNRTQSTYEKICSVEDWKKEAAQFRRIRQLRFFRNFIKAKTLLAWVDKVRTLKMERSRVQLSKRLLICQEPFKKDVASVSRRIFDLEWHANKNSNNNNKLTPVETVCIMSSTIRKESGFSSEDFISIQNQHSRDLKKYIADVLIYILSIVVGKASSIEKEVTKLPKLGEVKGVVGAVNKEIAEQEQYLKQRHVKQTLFNYGNVGAMVRLVHSLQLESIFRQACSTFFKLHMVTGSPDAYRQSVWTFKVDCIVDGGVLSLYPYRENVVELAKSVLSNSLASISSIPTCADSDKLNKQQIAQMEPLDPGLMLANDALINDYFSAIVSRIEEDYDEAFKKIAVFEPFVNASTFASEWETVKKKWSTSIEQGTGFTDITEAEFRSQINKAFKLQSDIKKLSGRSFGTIVVTCTNTIQSTASRLDSIISQINNFLSTVTDSQSAALKDELVHWTELLKAPALESDMYIEWLLNLREGEEEYVKFSDSVSDLQNLFHLTTELYDKCHPDDDPEKREYVEPDLTQNLKDPFVEVLSNAKRFNSSNEGLIKKQIIAEHDSLLTSMQEMRQRLQSVFGSVKADEGTPALSKLERSQETISNTKTKSRQLDSFADILEMETLNWSEIGVTEDELKKYVELWKVRSETTQLQNSLKTEPVSSLNGQELKDTTITLFQRAFKTSKIIPGDASSTVLEALSVEKAKLPLYVELCNPALTEDYWQELFEKSGIKPIGSEVRTLKNLDAVGLLEHEEEITDVVSNAVGVYELQQQIAKIEKHWGDREFEVVPYAGRASAFVIDGADLILEELEEQQVSVQTCLASKYVDSIREKVETWEADLNTIRAVILEWVAVQKSWMYLEFIFSSDDIKRQLPDETLLFSSADRFFSTLMKKASEDAHVAPLCLEGGDALKKLEKCTYQLDCIQKKLDEYLETKRVAFPRFYFLSNDELLSILSDSRNPLAVQPHLQKCFDNIKKLVFKDSKTISAMQSSEGEVVPFSNEIKIMGNVENWLNDVEKAMRETLYDALKKSIEMYTKEKRTEWYFEHPAQCVATTDQIVWTGEVELVITDAMTNESAWGAYMKSYQEQLLATVALVKKDLDALQRQVVSNLIVVDVHSRDICKQLSDMNCNAIVDFEWQKQLRYYWTEPERDSTVKDCVIRHGAAQLSYGYEYLGNQPRLVITPLTERAFLTCTAALHMHKGAAPQGPAGTGKTESVKDLGKALARQVVVFNCSDGLNYKMMSQMFAGLAQGGAWACFDEFNRIELEVLSVIAQQMLDITTAIANRQSSMLFEGHNIKLHPNFGVFITMNPGYAGRTELPDNLKALFRPICMMIPNYALIAEIMFYSEGYTSAGNLAKKMIHLYSLASQQLSKQDHYDFGMRAVKSILVLAGRLKRADPDTDEELLLVKAIRDANLPKFLTDDTFLFLALIKDFFPAVDEVKEGVISTAIGAEVTATLTGRSLQATAGMVSKAQQLFDTLTTRHGVMLVGHTMTGKSTVRDSLATSLTRMGTKKAALQHLGARYMAYLTTTNITIVNPKSITMVELYGDVNSMTREWQDGIFSSIVRTLVEENAAGAEGRHWVVFDGPVDAIWIENLNTVLDDNKMLCLVNGERIRIPEPISLLFEVQDLRVASPATVSRCGMVYVDGRALDDGWRPILLTLSAEAAKEFPAHWRHERFMYLCDLAIPPLLAFLRTECKEYVKSVDAQLASSLFYMLKASMHEFTDLLDDKPKEETKRRRTTRQEMTESAARRASRRRTSMNARASAVVLGDALFDAFFVQSCAWGLGGNLADGFRDRFAAAVLKLVRDNGLHFPASAEDEGKGVFDYCMSAEVGDWCPWSSIVPPFRYNASLSFFDLVVPTEHTVILNYLLQCATSVQRHLLFNGLTGTAKSSTVNNFLQSTLRTEDAASEFVAFSFTLSAQTTSNNLQETVESKLTRRKGDRELGPPVGKKAMIAVIDDCNVPQLEEYGAAPPIELLRQMITQGGFYDRKKLFFKEVVQTMLIACCGEPGGGKNEMTPRFTSKMMSFCVPQLSQHAMRSIFTAILDGFFHIREFAEEIAELAGSVVDSTLEVYSRIAVECLPTPEKTHYTFNLRDVSKVIQGILQVKPAACATKADLVQLWSHETSRVFHDRLVDENDRSWWWRCSAEVIKKNFSGTEAEAEGEGGAVAQPLPDDEKTLRSIMYGSWGTQASRDYKRITFNGATQEVAYQYLAEYNLQSTTPMDLVLFGEAVQHLSRICRIVNQPRGHALLVGVGGSGRTSLCRLASSMMNMELQTVNITRGYSIDNFRDEMRKALLDGGARDKDVVFQLSDPQIVFKDMLEDINNVLNIGEVPGMMGMEETEVIMRFCREPCLAAGRPDTRTSIYQFFVSRCRERVHMMLCMSPMSGSFRERLRMFPALVNCTTIDWFTEWPQDALLAVASAQLSKKSDAEAEAGEAAGAVTLSEADTAVLSQLLVYIHRSVKDASAELYAQMHRRNHTTPTSYLAAIALFRSTCARLARSIQDNAKRYRTGLEKLDGANATIAVLKQQISDMQPALTAALSQAEDQKKTVALEQKDADVMKQEMSKEEAAAQELMREAEGIRKECEEGLQEALPALEAAEKALETLSAKDIQEIKTFTTPPSNVEKTMNAVLILLKEKEGWATAKACLGKMDFITRLTGYPRDDITAAVIKKLAVYVNDPDFIPEVIEKTSLPCRSMCMWVHAMNKYYYVAKEIAPKRARLAAAEEKVAAARADLVTKQTALQKVLDRIAQLEAAAKAAQDEADRLNNEIQVARDRLQRADQLTSGLASERVRWEASLKDLEKQRHSIIGTAALGAGAVAYLGAFPAPFRTRLVRQWRDKCSEIGLKFDEGFALEKMMPDNTVQHWALQSLPRDTFSVQNATILERSARWCYMIDPQGQANAFIRKKEGEESRLGLLVLKLTDDNFMRSIENAVQVGQPVLLESVGETLDAALDPILLRLVRRTGGRNVVQIGDKEVTYDDRFRLYITTKLSNPVLTPELQVKVTVLNFTVTREGLEDQLLADIVGTERAALQQSSDRCIVSISASREEIRGLEERVLRMLSEATGDVLDNIDLINALQTSKETSEKIAVELATVEETNAKITETREKYRPLATQGSLIYSVISSLANVDSMYEYSLQFFKSLVVSVLIETGRRAAVDGGEGDGGEGDGDAEEEKAKEREREEEEEGDPTDEEIAARVAELTEEVTWTSFRVVCRGLFEKHKLLFSFLMTTTVMRSREELPEEEWELFLRGGVGRALPAAFSADANRPSYMNTVMWTDLGALCATAPFAAVSDDFFARQAEWRRWFVETHGDEVLAKVPAPVAALSHWHQVMLMKTIRPEKLNNAVKLMVQTSLGERYTRAPAFSISEAFKDSSKTTPIIFVLSPGTDPTALFTSFADEMGFTERKYMLSLGQDQGPRAQKMIEDGRRDGSWVYLQNCHVYASWMPKLQQLVEAITPNDTNDDFRLWLTSSPSPSFPAAVLQAGMKLTREPPLGLKGKIHDILSSNTIAEAWGGAAAEEGAGADDEGDGEDQWQRRGGHGAATANFTPRWKRLAFTLAFFHSAVMERRHYSPLGWNLPYDWGAADFTAGLSTITTALSRYGEDEPVPWPELLFMLGTIDYGGRVTDMWDTRCLEVIAKQYFTSEGSSANSGTAGSIGFVPALPDDASYDDLLRLVDSSVSGDASPEMYGLHSNASIAVDRKASADLVQALVNINSGGADAGGGGSGDGSGSDGVEDNPTVLLAKSLLARLPAELKLCHAVSEGDTPEKAAEAPLQTLLSHEIDLYNRLIAEIRNSLMELVRAMKGKVVMTAKTEATATRLGYNLVPDSWRSVGYLSLKPLASYFDDFLQRIAFIDAWRRDGPPPSFWLPGLFFPQGFITAVLQSRSRALQAPIDSLHFRFRALTPAESEAARARHTPGLVGSYVYGIYLEGCGWDSERGGLVEARPGALTVELPVLHFEPVGADAKEHYARTYDCPLYKVSSRAGTLSTTGVSTNYIVTLQLPSLDDVSADHWTLRGVAGLCSLDV